MAAELKAKGPETLQIDPVLYSYMTDEPLKPECPSMTRVAIQRMFIQFAIEKGLITDDSEFYTISPQSEQNGVKYLYD